MVATDAELLSPEYRDRVYGTGLLLQWIGVLGGPAVWMADLIVGYWLVYHACHTNTMVPLYVETLVVLGLAVLPFLAAYRTFQRFPEAHRMGAHADDRSRFMALTGMGMSLLFFLALVAAAVPRVVLTPCP